MKHLYYVTVLSLLLCSIAGNTFANQMGNEINPILKNVDTIKLPNKISIEDKLYTLSTIWSEIKYNFVNIDQLKFNPDSLYKSTIPLIIASKNDIDYYKELQRFICSFGDGHTQLMNVSYSWNDYFDYIPCLIEYIDGGYYFTSIRKGSGVDSVLLGAKVVEIEGVSTIRYIEENYFPFISASTLENKFFQASKRIGQGIKYSYLKGKAKKRNGEVVNFSIQSNGESTRTKNDEMLQIRQLPKRRAISLFWKNEIAILEINTFNEPVIPLIDSLMKIAGTRAKGLIIDLRHNGGGVTTTALHLQKYLTKGDYFLSFGSQTRINNGYGRSQGNYRKEYEDYYLGKAYMTNMPDTVFVEKSFKRINCPVVILTGKMSFSACEDFLVNIYEVPDRPLLIGETTGGSTGAPLVLFNLPNETSARICTLRILYPYSMKPFVNKGISPDIEIKETIEDYINGKDVVLNRAIQSLQE
jgi:carboxyl-terminal processing protease